LVVVASNSADGSDRVNWSIRLSSTEAARWDDLIYTLRKETDRRTLSKADTVRALLDLTLDNPTARKMLVSVLTAEAKGDTEPLL
jgi:hypothetical protein